jgi:predicted DNA-binding transcriptional regulator YafY
LVSWHGRWYVGGHDLDRDAPRVFRLSRIAGGVEATGPEKAYDVPPDVDVRSMVSAAFADDDRPARQAQIKVVPGTGHRLRATGVPAASDPDLLTLEFVSLHGFAELLTGYGANVTVVQPTELRTAVIERLRAVAGGVR